MSTLAKTALTAAPLHPLLAERWSPRAFDVRHQLTAGQVTALLEAARWAPSASNTQPWRFAVTLRGTAEHAAFLDALAPGNRAWAHAASALIVVAAETVGADGASRPWAAYDTGQAVAHLSVQAQHEGLAVHQLGGFDRDRIAAVLALPDGVEPQVVLAVGRRADGALLAEPFARRETAARDRLPLDDLLLPVAAAAAWLALVRLIDLLPQALDRQLREEAGIGHVYYQILAMLSGAPEGRLRMTELARVTATSSSRLSHAVAALEDRGWVTRRSCPTDRRGQFAELTPAGREVLEQAAPGHVAEVRSRVFDRLDVEEVAQPRSIATKLGPAAAG